MWNCPICGTKVTFEEVYTDGEVNRMNFPTTIYDYWCKKGHLIQGISPANVWQVFTLNNDGDELWVLVFNLEWELIEIIDWQNGLNSCDLEGGSHA